MILSDQIEYACLTDVGVRRSHNQDNHAVLLAVDAGQWEHHGHLFLVADGMGAHAVGEKASEQAARVIPHTYGKHFPEGPAIALRKAFVEANASIHAFGQANREFEGTGTTGTSLLLRPDGAWIAHVGDSRVYRVRDGMIEQLSYDHSLVWEYARLKKIDPSEVKEIPSNVIHRCLGPEPLVQVDIEGPHPLRAGDRFILCSDGLSGPVSDREIGAVVSVLPPAEACRLLVDLANLRGGPDNITVVVVHVGGSSPDSNGEVVPVPVAPPPRSWLLRIPWPHLTLVAGTFIAATATTLHAFHVPGSLVVFVLAVLAIGAGLAGLLLHVQRERATPVNPDKPQPPRVHRRTSCAVEAPLLDRLSRAMKSLRLRADERKWDLDWAVYEAHQAQAEEQVRAGDLAGAYREYCRAMLPLTQALNRQRNKEEEFKPMWDRTA